MPQTKSQQKTPEAGPSNKPARAKESESKGRKREGDSIEARPKKTRIISAEYIDDSDEETVVKSESRTPAGAMSGLKVFVEIPPKPKSKSQAPAKSPAPAKSLAPAKSKAKPQQVTDLMRRPRFQTPLDADAKSTMTASEIRLHNSQVRLQKLNVAIAAGKYRHAATPCHACTRRLDRNTVPCAESITGDSASCFTCRAGKTTCSFVQGAEGQVKIVRKREKKSKGKQDVEMAEVGHDAEHAIDVDMADKVGQTKEKGQQKQSEGRNGSIDVEMAEVEHVETKVGIGAQLEPDMARATPAIVIEPPTPSPDKGKGREIQPPVSEKALAVAEVQGKNPFNLFFLTNFGLQIMA